MPPKHKNPTLLRLQEKVRQLSHDPPPKIPFDNYHIPSKIFVKPFPELILYHMGWPVV
jgi:hypothetical protein